VISHSQQPRKPTDSSLFSQIRAGGLAITTWSLAQLWLSSCTFDKAYGLWQSRCFAPPGLPGTGTGGVAKPSRTGLPGQARSSDGLGTARLLFLASRIEEAPHAPRVGAGAAAPPPKTTITPTNQRLTPHRLLHTLGQVGEQYGPSIAPFARASARCPFSPLLRPYSPPR
jgi:hypothetical protein